MTSPSQVSSLYCKQPIDVCLVCPNFSFPFLFHRRRETDSVVVVGKTGLPAAARAAAAAAGYAYEAVDAEGDEGEDEEEDDDDDGDDIVFLHFECVVGGVRRRVLGEGAVRRRL